MPKDVIACQACESLSAWLLSVIVPTMSATAVVAKNVAPIIRLRSVCTARMPSLSFIMRSTQATRPRFNTAWIV